MKKANNLKEKSFQFALDIIKLSQTLLNKKEYIISKQLIRSGTSVGAQIREAEFAESRADFIHKLSLAQKEINESIYWLEILQKSEWITIEEFNPIHFKAIEILKILISIITKVKNKKLITNN
jgi:four helix bundle protein